MTMGFERLAAMLAESGSDTMFGVMGEGNLDLINEWTQRGGLRYVPARHEAAAVAMATGYAHVTGRPGLCTVTHGPGLANTVTALTSAVRARLPVLLVAGDLAAGADRAHPQRVDQGALVQPTGTNFIDLGTAGTAPARLREALDLLATTGCPVVLNAPTDVQRARWPEPDTDETPAAAVTAAAAPGAPAAARAAVAEAVALLAGARAPVVLAGEGAFRAGAAPVLTALADHLGALLTTSLKAKGLFAEHPLDVGVSGGFAAPAARALLPETDCLLVVGATLNRWTTDHGRLYPDATVIHCDLDEAVISAVTTAAVALPGDATAIAGQLLTGVRERTGAQPRRRQARARAVAEHRRRQRDEALASPLLGQRAMAELDRLLPADRAVVVDGGHFMGYPSTEIGVAGPGAFLWTSHFGSIGLGLGTAIGAAAGRPERTTVLVVGDGGLMMSLGELDTLARCGLPLVVVAMNDSAYGAEVHFLRERGLPAEAAQFDPVPLVEVARAVGLRSYRVTDPARELPPVAAMIRRREGPIFVEIVLDHHELAPWFRSYLELPHP